MNKTLYEEAIADAKQLRELAEDEAKNRVIEAVMPQIRDLVNRRILGEDLEELEMEDEVADDILDVIVADELPFAGPDAPTVDVQPSAVVNVTAQGDVNIEVESEDDHDDEVDDLVLTDTMAEALGRLIRGEVKVEPTTKERVVALEVRVSKLRILNESLNTNNLTKTQKTRLNLAFIHCLREALNLRSTAIISESDTQDKLERRLSATIQEMKQMSKSNQKNIFDFLFENEEEVSEMSELEEAELSLELEEEEVEDLAGADDAAAVDAALADILGDVEMSLAVEDTVDGDAPEDEEEELDFGAPEAEEATEEEASDDDEVIEIDEGMLRKEIRRMRKLREQEEGRAADADPSLAHGGEDLGDVILDIDEEDLLNALADELGDVAAPDAPSASVAAGVNAMPESRQRRQRRLRRTRTARVTESNQIKRYRKAVTSLKKQLVEMNLFNAKLLYANKLMQNKNLSTKQQKAIVEAIDNAKTLREAKLLYKSLSESLTRRARGKNLNEGTLRTLGSSSRSTRSAQPTKNGVESDRWAVLAGLNNGND
jgi:hypothetical protein